MTPEDYEELIELLDNRIDELTKPLPSRQILRFVEAIHSAKEGEDDSEVTYGEDDYANLVKAQQTVNEQLTSILESIRSKSIDPNTGWRLEAVIAAEGDRGLCAICKKPYQHFDQTVAIHCLDMREGSYDGVCRECVRYYGPLEFVDDEAVDEWLKRNPDVSKEIEENPTREEQRIELIDAVRRHAHSTHYFGDIVRKAPEWAKGAFGEWR